MVTTRWTSTSLKGPFCLAAQALAILATPLASTSSDVVPGLQVDSFLVRVCTGTQSSNSSSSSSSKLVLSEELVLQLLQELLQEQS